MASWKDHIILKLHHLLEHYKSNLLLKEWNAFLQLPNIQINNKLDPKYLQIFKGNNNVYGEIKIDEDFSFREHMTILVYPKAKLRIGKNVFFNNFCSINCLDHIQIGENTLFGEGVKLYDHNHEITKTNELKIAKEHFKTAPIFIGKNCWLASNVIILKGVIIGDNVVIGAGCVIHKSIPANSIVKNDQNLIIETI